MIYAVLAASAVAFAPPASIHHATVVRSTVSPVMSADAPLSRREALFGAAAAAAFTPLAAFADGAGSPQVLAKSRAIYGSRIFRLQGASPEKVLEEKNMFTIFTSSAYRSAKDKEVKATLKGLEKKIIAAATKGDAATTSSLVKEFVAVGKIKELDVVPGANFNPQQRRNPGAPGTAEIEAQMGTQAFALYQPLKPK